MPTFRQDNKLGDSVPLIKTPDIGDKQVTERKLADGSVTSSKLSTEIANMLSLLTTRISAFKVADNLSSLPTEENTIGWLVDNHLYVYVGNGSTPESGMYQDCGELRGPQGIQGEQGLSGLNGKSAYDIWTEQPGNEDKSEIDFLEFTRGSKGDKGDQGERGYDISNIEQIVKSTEDGGKNIIRVTRSDGWSKVFEIFNGSKGSKGDKGTSIVKLEQTRKTTESSGLNTIEATLGDGTKESFEIYNGAKGEQGDKGEKGDKGDQGEIGPQGNSGIADASNKTLVNDAITGGETDFLSAEVGKLGILTYDCSKGGTVTHTTLQDAINSVPTTFQKVGLTITYKSGDTIYRYTLKANTWSADPANWFSVEDKLNDLSDKVSIKDEEGNVQDTPFRVIENEEFIKAVVDSEDRILYGIYRDTGKPYYPQNDMYHISQSEEFLWVILDAANHPLLGIQQDGTCWAAKAQWLDDIKAIKEALSSIGEALKTFQPKEDGKGLINLDVAGSFFYISNDEYIIAVVDAENRILAGIKYDAQPYFPNHEMYSVIANEEWLYAIIDADNKVLCGFRADDGHMVVGGIDISTFITNAIIDIADIKKRTAHLSTIENDEYLAVEQDAEGKVLSATNPDGSHYIHKVKSETILTQIEEKTDIENRLEMTLDEEGHILSYRDKNGVKHETALDVEHFSMKGESIDFSNYATQDDVNGIELKNIDGVYDNSKPNLYLTSQKTYTTADGKQSFTPPNAGAEMSNKIPCKPGEWFTRTGTATGMVVVSDKNDNNAKRLMPNGSLPKASVQVPEYWDWAAYIRFAVATYENNVTINRGKYAVSESSESVSIPKLKLNVANFTKETKYLKSPNGTFFELSVSDKGVLSVKEIDKDLVAPFDVPSDLKFTISNPSGGAAVFCGNANRVLLHNEKYLYEVKETGLTKFLSIADSSAYFYNVEHQVNSSGKSRIVALLKVDPFKGLCVFDENFILIDQLASPNYDTHDFIYIDDFHYIVYYHSNVLTIDGHMTYSDTLEEWKNGKKIGSYTLNDQDVLRDILFDADVHSTAPIAETHTNTIGFDRTEDRIIVNPRNCCSWIILKRTVSSEDKVTFGPVLEQVGGLPSSSNYGAVARRIKTDSLAQWFLCHDVKYWGMKEISGVSYPTYTLFDNNFLMKENPRNNPTSNPTGATDNAATCSRIVQLSIDWSKRKIVEYKVYVVPSYYSNVMSSAWMMDEGMFCIDYAMMGTIIFADFTTEATTVSEDNHLYTNAKITWKLKQQKLLYRANIY